MPKQPMAPPDGRKPGKPKNPGLSVNQMSTPVLARDIPMYFKKQPPLDPEAFVYVEVVQFWPELGKVSLTDARMTKTNHGPARFFAFFTGGCTGILEKAKPQDKFCLYLSDAAIRDVEEQCKQNTLNLPFTLTYDRICRLRHVEKDTVGPSVTFPTAKERQTAPANGKRKKSSRKKAAPSVSEEMHPGLEPAPIEAAVTGISHCSDAAPAEVGALPEDRPPAHQPEEVHRAKRRKWMNNEARRERRESAKVNRPSGPPSGDVEPETGRDDAKATPPKVSGDDSNSPKEVIDLTIKEESPPGTPILLQDPQPSKGPVSLKAGRGPFSPLGDISRSTDIRKVYSTIGVVTHARDVTETRTKELSQRIHLSDPSYPSEDDQAASPMGHGITMFAKRYKEWLPSPKCGDILILKGIKQVRNNQFGNYGSVIFGDKLKWAIFDPVTESVVHGDPSGAPRESGGDYGRGAMVRPFYDPEPGDILYCRQLSEWWETVGKRRVDEHELVAQCVSVTTRRPTHRIHRLISETDHESEPGGYFDCTVQVLRGFKNDNGVYSLYVTDFTKNEGLAKNDKWPNGRDGMILKIEMWDAAASRGPGLRNKGYYRLENCRMLNHDNYLQAKLVEPKIRELSKEDEKDMADSKFAELLRREAEFEKGNDVPLTLENAPDESFFNSIVELLDRTSDGDGMFLHVTDYTLVPEIFKSVFSQEPRFEHLRGRVVKVRVRGSLAERASSMPMVNSYYLLEKMRFWQMGEVWVCDIKENHGWIQKLNPANGEKNGMAEVKRRKKELGSSTAGSDGVSGVHSLATDPREKPLGATMGVASDGSAAPLPKVSALPPKEELPTCFEVKAKILDFYPITLDEGNCLLRVCGDCNKSIARTAESCLDCSTMTHQAPVIFRYSLLFMLGTGNGEEFVATAGNIDNRITSGINGQDEDDALHRLKAVLKPLVGNLFEIHECWLRQEESGLQPNTPLANFKLNAWGEERDGGTVVRYAVQDIVAL